MKQTNAPGSAWAAILLKTVSCAAATAVLLAVPFGWKPATVALSALAEQAMGQATAQTAADPAETAVPEGGDGGESPAAGDSEGAGLTGDETPPPAANADTAVTVSVTDGKATASTARAVAASAGIVPPKDGTGGTVSEQMIPTGDPGTLGVATKNRSNTAVDIAAALATPLKIGFTDTDEPQVLIIHTHTTENYMTYDAGYYNAADRKRTQDHSKSVCAVGEALAAALAQEGIASVHDTTLHDYPKYSGAYARSEETVKKDLKKYPSVKVVLDLHRDGIMTGKTGLVKPTVTVNGRKAAQCMIIAGVVSTAALPHPQWRQNLAFATQLQRALTADYPKLMRPLSTVASRYNQHLAPGYLLIEMGSEGNTVDEAVYSGQLLGKTLAKLLKQA